MAAAYSAGRLGQRENMWIAPLERNYLKKIGSVAGICGYVALKKRLSSQGLRLAGAGTTHPTPMENSLFW
jgi:hypothetical protein